MMGWRVRMRGCRFLSGRVESSEMRRWEPLPHVQVYEYTTDIKADPDLSILTQRDPSKGPRS